MIYDSYSATDHVLHIWSVQDLLSLLWLAKWETVWYLEMFLYYLSNCMNMQKLVRELRHNWIYFDWYKKDNWTITHQYQSCNKIFFFTIDSLGRMIHSSCISGDVWFRLLELSIFWRICICNSNSMSYFSKAVNIIIRLWMGLSAHHQSSTAKEHT